MIRLKLCELLMKYENGQFKDGDIFIHQNYSQMTATFKSGNFVWYDDNSAINCKDITNDVWILKNNNL
ncbi:hypothetical protein COE50_26085 [Bacillus anthracis]|nr:hypothetical protein COE50_26085 [Bacillus anthracis]